MELSRFMTTFIAAGDSFTWGNDLPDCDHLIPSQFTWAALLAKHFNFNYRCVAVPGGPNRSIERVCINAVETALANNESVVVGVMWTYPHRLEYKLNERVKDNSDYYYTISQWHTLDFEEKMELWGKVDEARRSFVARQHEEFQQVGVTDISIAITKHVTDDYYFAETLRSQILLRDYLTRKAVPYFYLPACDNVVLDRIETKDAYVKTLIADAKTANWVPEPVRRGFVQWAMVNDYKIGFGNHPLQPAHKDYFEKYILPYVKSTVNVGV